MADLNTSIAIKILDMFTGPLRKLDAGLKDVEATAERAKKKMAFAADMNQAAESLNRFGQGVIGPLRDSVKEFATFEAAMSQVSALSGEMKGGEGFDALKAKAMELGATTSFSSEEAANAMAVFAQAGRKTNEILALTPATMAAARANGLGLAETASIVNHTMSQMGLGVSEADRVIDVLTAGAAASDMSLSDMGTALAYVGPVAAQSGMSLEKTAAILGKMKDAGLEASSTGVGLRAVLSRLVDPSKEAQGAFAKLGFNAKQLAALQKQVASGNVDQALKAIGQAAEKLPNERRMKLMSQIFGMEAQTAATVAIKASMDSQGITALTAELQASAGKAKQLAAVMDDNLNGALERASGAISGVKVAAGEALAPTMGTLATAVEEVSGYVQAFIKKFPNLSGGMLELTAGVGITALAFGGLLTTAASLTSALAFTTTQMAVLRGTMAGQAGLVGVALMAGWAIGRFLDRTLGITEWIMDLMGLSKAIEAKKGLGPKGGEQTLRGGWVIDPTTGAVKKTGTAETAPASVRAALRSGAKTPEEMNAFLTEHNKPKGFSVVPQGRPVFERVAPSLMGQYGQRAAELTSPLAEVKPFSMVTEEQTATLVDALRRIELGQDKVVESNAQVAKMTQEQTERRAYWMRTMGGGA